MRQEPDYIARRHPLNGIGSRPIRSNHQWATKPLMPSGPWRITRRAWKMHSRCSKFTRSSRIAPARHRQARDTFLKTRTKTVLELSEFACEKKGLLSRKSATPYRDRLASNSCDKASTHGLQRRARPVPLLLARANPADGRVGAARTTRHPHETRPSWRQLPIIALSWRPMSGP